MIFDHLQRQAHRLARVLGKLQQQPVAVVQLGAVVAAAVQLLHVGALEIPCFDGRTHLGKRGLDPSQIEISVLVSFLMVFGF